MVPRALHQRRVHASKARCKIKAWSQTKADNQGEEILMNPKPFGLGFFNMNYPLLPLYNSLISPWLRPCLKIRITLFFPPPNPLNIWKYRSLPRNPLHSSPTSKLNSSSCGTAPWLSSFPVCQPPSWAQRRTAKGSRLEAGELGLKHQENCENWATWELESQVSVVSSSKIYCEQTAN